MKRQITRGQAHFDRTVARVSDDELAKLLDRAQFDRVKRDPSHEPLVASFLERVASGDFEALATDLENGTIDLNPVFYATDMVIRGTNIGRPFDYNRHYAVVCRECARRRTISRSSP